MASPVAGLRPMPRLAVHTHQAADTGDDEHAVLLGFANGQFRKTCDELLGYLGGAYRWLPASSLITCVCVNLVAAAMYFSLSVLLV